MKGFNCLNALVYAEVFATIKIKNNGGKRIVVAYLSIGEAENYRFYWNKNI